MSIPKAGTKKKKLRNLILEELSADILNIYLNNASIINNIISINKITHIWFVINKKLDIYLKYQSPPKEIKAALNPIV